MSTKRNRQAALLSNNTTEVAEPKNKDSAIQRRMELIEGGQRQTQHQPVCNSLKIKLDHMRTIVPLTENQAKFFNLYKTGSYFMGLFGSAGTGKTYCALAKALEEVLDKGNSFKHVVVVRSCVQTRDVGFLPGSIDEKQEIFQLPYREICSNLFDRPDAYERLKEQGYIRFISTTAIRGISIDDSVIVVDESQSNTFHELSTIISRVGHRSKIIFCGDMRQNDLIKNKNDVSGFLEFQKIARSMKEFSEINFTTDDIVRSSLVKSWIIAAESFGY